jgi:hypothetical protein
VGFGLFYSPDGINWVEQDLDYNNYLHAVTVGKTKFAAVGAFGSIFTSGDGIHWDLRTRGTMENLEGVTYGRGLYVSVGDSGTILTSRGGKVWRPRQSGTANNLNYVAYLNGLYIAVGDMGTILTSANGIHWQVRDSGMENDLNSVAYGNSLFVAVGAYAIVTSGDGVNWEAVPGPPPVYLNGVAFGGSQFVAVGSEESILLSPDGVSWQVVFQGGGWDEQDFYDVIYGGDRFVAVQAGSMMISEDGFNWERILLMNPFQAFRRLAYAGGTYIAVGQSFWCRNILTSTDALNWENHPPVTCNNLVGVTDGDSAFMVVGEGGTILRAHTGGNH